MPTPAFAVESRTLRLTGGDVFDPDGRSITVRDVVIAGDMIGDKSPTSDVESFIDVTGLLVTPGLVDLHTHVFRGQMSSVDPTVVGPASGTTTMIDTGSAGAHLLDAFRSIVSSDPAIPRVLSFLNISSIGITGHTLQGELRGLAYCDEDTAVRVADANRDFVVGIKVRASADVAGADAFEALGRARRVADRLGLPLMCHLGPAPVSSDDILRVLREGDVLTHAFTGFSDNYVTRDRHSLDALKEAHDRGVVLDVGHGASGFSISVAMDAVANGVPPTTISSDVHRVSLESVVGLPRVLSKLLALGMPLPDVLLRATSEPARVVGADRQGVGTLRTGAPADVAVFRIVNEPITFIDPFGGRIDGGESLHCVLTIMGGQIVYHDGSLDLSHLSG
jgi:dihydroorotase